VTLTIPRLMTVAASATVGAGVVTGVVDGSQLLLVVSVAAIVGVAVGWIIVRRDAHSPVGPSVAWSVAAIAAVNLPGVLGPHLPWSTALWPLNLAGVFALLLVFPDGPRPGRLWSTLPWAFLSAELGLQICLWGSTEVGGRVTGSASA
jgi:hypothetical protein